MILGYNLGSDAVDYGDDKQLSILSFGTFSDSSTDTSFEEIRHRRDSMEFGW